jgi:hypothetical protein
MKYGKALAAGVVGDIVMTIIMIMGRAMVMPANLEMILGITMGRIHRADWLVGLGFRVIHTLFSGLVGGRRNQLYRGGDLHRRLSRRTAL